MRVRLTGQFLNGGVFSHFMLMMQNIVDYSPKEIGGIYMDCRDHRIHGNPFTFVLANTQDSHYIEKICTNRGIYTHKEGLGNGLIEKDKNFEYMKLACKKIIFHYKINEWLKMYSETYLTGNTLGIHIRTGDMSVIHPQYGKYLTEDYIKKANELIVSEQINTIFVATDNFESLSKAMNQLNCRVVFFPCALREKLDTFDNPNLQEVNLFSERLWEECFMEALLLSRCNQLLCTTSNLTNAAILFSDSITKIHRL